MMKPRLRTGYIVALAILVILMSFVGWYWRDGGVKKEAPTTYIPQFDADESRFIFAHPYGRDDLKFVIYDTATREFRAVTDPGRILLSPQLNRDRLLISSRPRLDLIPTNEVESYDKSTVVSHLMSCLLPALDCRVVFSRNGSIANALQLDNGHILFVGGETETVADPFTPERPYIGFRKFDFFLASPEGDPERLTSEQFALLDSVSVSPDRIFFNAIGNAFARAAADRRETSEIYSARLDRDHRLPEFSAEIRRPHLTYGKRQDLWPSASPSGQFLAFLSAVNSASGVRAYEIVVYDRVEGRERSTIKPPATRPRSFSRPILIDESRIRYMSSDGAGYILHEASVATGQSKVVGRLAFDEADGLVPVEIFSGASRTLSR